MTTTGRPGRFNLVDIDDGTTELGYRVARRVAGRGVATVAEEEEEEEEEVCRAAASELGLRTLRTRTTYENVASQRELTRAALVAVGAADVGGRTGIRFERSQPDADFLPGEDQR